MQQRESTHMKTLAEEWKRRDKERELMVKKKVKNITTLILEAVNLNENIQTNWNEFINNFFFNSAGRIFSIRRQAQTIHCWSGKEGKTVVCKWDTGVYNYVLVLLYILFLNCQSLQPLSRVLFGQYFKLFWHFLRTRINFDFLSLKVDCLFWGLRLLGSDPGFSSRVLVLPLDGMLVWRKSLSWPLPQSVILLRSNSIHDC